MKIYIAALKEEIQEMDFFHLSGVGKINATYKCLELIQQFKPTEIISAYARCTIAYFCWCP